MSGLSLVLSCKSCSAKNRVQLDKVASSPHCGSCHGALPPPTHPLELNDTNLGDLVKVAALPVLVDFWAQWCGPCRTFAPTLEKFAAESGGRMLVGKVDVDKAPSAARLHEVNSIPTLVLFREGREALRHVGTMSLDGLRRFASAR